MTDRHIVRLQLRPRGHIDLHVWCRSSDDAECRVDNGDDNGFTVCRYIQWWEESDTPPVAFYVGEVTPISDNAEINIFWGGEPSYDEAWVWELKK
jgi:hypothetical protein